jgi:predicted NBD/HSP70 family sugar kinase
MYAGIDIGGSKTLVASLDDNGVILEKVKFPTPKSYDDFLSKLASSVQSLEHRDFRAAGVGAPATHLDRRNGIGISFGNLPWKRVPLLHDAEKLLGCPVALENDAKVAALSEAMMVKDEFQKVLYVTVSTGIGIGLVINRVIDTSVGDGGGRLMELEYKGKLTPWENFASGRAIVERYGKKAQDITDASTWRSIARDLATGLVELIALFQPEVIIFGGSVGTYFDRFGAALQAELNHHRTPLIDMPQLRGAARPELAVVYGCYDLAVQHFGHIQLGELQHA